LIKFDFDTDLRFRDSLDELGAHESIEVFDALSTISAQRYHWGQFVDEFGWKPLDLVGVDTFPGCIELHQFIIQGSSSQLYEVIGYTHQNVVIICAVVRKATL